MDEVPSPNHDDRPAATPIDMLVLHYTGMTSAAEAIERLADPRAKVSAHYLIDEDGRVVRMVAETRRAWHAGVASWRGQTDVNARSIGIELVNPGHEFGYRAFPDAQIAALTALAHDILGRHAIPPRNVVGHSDVAPTRKTDPGELFPWADLSAEGIGLWPGGAGASDLDTADGSAADLLGRFGYDTDDLAAAIAAFQRHFRPRLIDGVADRETMARLQRLLELVG
jgi:N-acetylmuramoyl-L-alanine amidase